MLRLFASILFSLLSLLKAPNYNPASVIVNSGYVGPYKEFDSDTTISFNYRYYGYDDTLNEVLKVYNNETNSLLYKTTTSAHLVKTGKKYVVTMTLKLKKYLSVKGLKIELSVENYDVALFHSSAVIFPYSNEEIDVNGDGVERLVSKSLGFYIRNSNIYEIYDDFNFVNFKDYIDAENYYSLELNENSFLYNSDELSYESASICIPDEERILKNFHHDINGNINLPLEICDDGEEKRFLFKNYFYVDRLTLDSADYQLPNYVQTKRLYLPVNKKDSFLGTDIILRIYGAGYNKYNLIFHLTYDVNRDLIGNCNESDFCIKGKAE